VDPLVGDDIDPESVAGRHAVNLVLDRAAVRVDIDVQHRMILSEIVLGEPAEQRSRRGYVALASPT
jgi:hypothetical protein